MASVDVYEHITAAIGRAARAREEARSLHEAGHPGPSLVWSVRAAEIMMRDFVLTPHFLEQGLDWTQAIRKGSKVLGDGNWARAFAKAEEWYGPFDQPMLEDDTNAWAFWTGAIVRRRGDVVHGRSVPEVSADEAVEAHAFAERMAEWIAQRFLISSKHPMGRKFRELVDGAVAERDANAE